MSICGKPVASLPRSLQHWEWEGELSKAASSQGKLDSSTGKLPLAIVKWQGRIHCVYLNDHRIAGRKPWGGGEVVQTFQVEVKDLHAAVAHPATSKRALQVQFLHELASWLEKRAAESSEDSEHQAMAANARNCREIAATLPHEPSGI